MKYMDLLAENTQNWDTACTCEALVEFSLIHLVETCTILEKIMTSKPNLHLQRKVEALELKRSGQLKSVQEIVCQICETNGHHLKTYFDNFPSENESIGLSDPVYKC